MKADINDCNDIRLLVDTFYRAAAHDDLLGPIFSRIQNQEDHKDALYKYWEDTLLKNVEDQPFPQHIHLMFTRRHFVRWIKLLLNTITDMYAGPMAEKAKVIVIRKSEEFQSKLALSRF
ncbi:MAG TPA: group III truncated hemoglobin [Chryseosolibacter sp.]|nr:group III truncated hemoglobin [Chryseosolibacter sp.]